ncbi:hypothetical protein K0M31_013939 [Melipona bicolor]|uniref:Uncharacterized protein n=1 Tax=Melipona bicolor TaxID=60889 RepID=A0AA40KTT5_9HYME|nr:hypothetical protein K0M31_013939 [Melipona bicolor]
MDLRISRSPLETKCCHVPRGRNDDDDDGDDNDGLGPAERTNIGNLSSAAKQALSRNDKNQTGRTGHRQR